MQNRKITLMTLDYPPQTGGVSRYLSELVRASHGEIDVIDAKPFLRRAWPAWWPLVSVIRRRSSGDNSHSVVFVSHVFPVGTAAWISHLIKGPNYVVLFHGLDLRLADSPWKRWLLRRVCHGSQALFCNSESTRETLKRLVPKVEATILTPGVEDRVVISRDEARRKLGIDPNAKLVLSVARLIPRKGIDVALHAMSRIQHERPVQYVVLGDGPDGERLAKIATESRTNVRWVRSADDEEKWSWLAASDVFILPVRDEGSDVEGFGIVFLEAAKAGIPSVAGRSGGAVEAVRHERTGLVVKPLSIDEVEAAIRRLLDDEDLRRRLGNAARVRVERDFRWEDRWKVLQERIGRTSRSSSRVVITPRNLSGRLRR